MRRSVFEDLVMTGEIDFGNEYNIINNLTKKIGFYRAYSILEIFDFIVPHWKYRCTTTNFYELLVKLKLTNKEIIFSGYDKNKVLKYFELVYTFCFMIKSQIDNPFSDFEIGMKRMHDVNDTNLKLILSNIESILEELNYEIQEVEFGRCEIVEKNSIATAVAESNPEIAGSIIEYRKYDLKGDIEYKRAILKELANKIEPLKSKFKSTNFDSIYKNTTFLLNNLNIRHNNEKDRVYIEISKDKELIEEWYDRTYNCIINILAIDEYLNFNKDIEILKQNSQK